MISKTLKCLIISGILLVMTSNAFGADNNWQLAGLDNLWSNPANWELGLPAKGDGNRPRIETGLKGYGFCVLDSPASADRMYVGDNSDEGLLYIRDGADLSIGRADIGDHGGAYGEIRMSGGIVNADNIWKVGKDGSGKIVMTGGLLIIDASLKMPSDVTDGSNTGHVQLDGGTLSIGALELGMGADGITSRGTGTIDITTGTLIIDGNDLYDDGDGISGSNVDDCGVYTHIAAGRITAYGDQGTLFVDYDGTNPGKTTLTALHKFNPVPADDSIVGAGAVELNWTLPDPCVPGQPVAVDVYFTDDFDALWQFTNRKPFRS